MCSATFASVTLVSDIRAAMAENGAAPADIEVELTESVLMADPERANEVLQQLHAMSVSLPHLAEVAHGIRSRLPNSAPQMGGELDPFPHWQR